MDLQTGGQGTPRGSLSSPRAAASFRRSAGYRARRLQCGLQSRLQPVLQPPRSKKEEVRTKKGLWSCLVVTVQVVSG